MTKRKLSIRKYFLMMERPTILATLEGAAENALVYHAIIKSIRNQILSSVLINILIILRCFMKKMILLSKEESFSTPIHLLQFMKDPDSTKGNAHPESSLLTMKKVCKRCMEIFNDHRKHHHVLHDACQLCNQMNNSSDKI
jgi:hypothetical protein